MLNLTSHKEYIASRTPITHTHEVYRLSKISISRCFLHTQAEMITHFNYAKLDIFFNKSNPILVIIKQILIIHPKSIIIHVNRNYVKINS